MSGKECIAFSFSIYTFGQSLHVDVIVNRGHTNGIFDHIGDCFTRERGKMDILVRNVVLTNNVDCGWEKVGVIYFVGAIGADY